MNDKKFQTCTIEGKEYVMMLDNKAQKEGRFCINGKYFKLIPYDKKIFKRVK